MKKVLTVRVEGLKKKPFYGLHKESYSKEMPENPKVSVFREELLEIQKRYEAIHRIEFIVEKIEIPEPFKGEISPKLVREAEKEAQRKQRLIREVKEEAQRKLKRKEEKNAHKS